MWEFNYFDGVKKNEKQQHVLFVSSNKAPRGAGCIAHNKKIGYLVVSFLK